MNCYIRKKQQIIAICYCYNLIIVRAIKIAATNSRNIYALHIDAKKKKPERTSLLGRHAVRMVDCKETWEKRDGRSNLCNQQFIKLIKQFMLSYLIEVFIVHLQHNNFCLHIANLIIRQNQPSKHLIEKFFISCI